jgi:hypothetical protein
MRSCSGRGSTSATGNCRMQALATRQQISKSLFVTRRRMSWAFVTPAGTAGAGHAQPAALVLRPSRAAPYRQDHPRSAGPPGDSTRPVFWWIRTSTGVLGRSRRMETFGLPPDRFPGQTASPSPAPWAAGQPVAVDPCETTSSEAGWPRCTVPCRPSTSGQKQGSSIRPTIVWRRWRDTDSSDLRPNSTRSGAAEASATSRSPTGSTATGIERTPRSISGHQ